MYLRIAPNQIILKNAKFSTIRSNGSERLPKKVRDPTFAYLYEENTIGPNTLEFGILWINQEDVKKVLVIGLPSVVDESKTFSILLRTYNSCIPTEQ